MSYCTDCIHYKVCGNEGVDDSAMTFCADKKTDRDLISRQDVEDAIAETIVNGESLGYGVAYDILSDIPPVTPLEQTDGDLISRQAVLDSLYALCDTGETLKENPWRDNPHIDTIKDAIDALPSVDNTAKWKRNEISLYYKCSNCKESAVMFPYPYCPLCGSKMTNYAKW